MPVIHVKVIPNSKKERISIQNGTFKIYVTSPPENNKANTEMLRMLARYLGKKPSELRIIKGRTRKEKIIEYET